jgi:ribonuclease HI
MTGMGGVIRDSDGNIIRLYAGSMGNSTNNAAEFGALEIGLEILSRERMTNTIVEGDSTGYQHSEETPKWHQIGQNSEALALGTLPAKNPGASANDEHSGVALGTQVSEWTGGQNR